jgi:hypothetical protein
MASAALQTPCNVRTLSGSLRFMVSVTPPSSRPLKASRIELRVSQKDRDLLDRAAAALGTDRSSFAQPRPPGSPASAG